VGSLFSSGRVEQCERLPAGEIKNSRADLPLSLAMDGRCGVVYVPLQLRY